MPAVSSSMMNWVEYNPNTKELSITFNSGRTCVYSGVSKETYEGLLQSDSQGKYFNQYIKDRYPFRG
jgi:hypothetical protein